MYSEADMNAINRRIRGNLLVFCPILIALVAVYIWALAARHEAVAMVVGALIFVVACFAIAGYLAPNLRYRGFLKVIQAGEGRQLRGCVVGISEAPEMQDGARVLPVRLMLTEEQDERIVYLNTSKQDQFPPVGTEVVLHCFGRHILSVDLV